MGNAWEDNEDEMNEFEENNGANFIDVKDLKERVEDYPLSSYFLETRKNAKKRSATSWLEYCDEDTVSLICCYCKKIIQSKYEENAIAEENTSNDIFDEKNENDKILIDEEDDLYSLVTLILAWENNYLYVDSNILQDSACVLSMYAAIDILRRNGVIESKGCGTLLSKNTEYILTKKCKKMSKKELNAVLKTISATNKPK
jgi:hypothetical protein